VKVTYDITVSEVNFFHDIETVGTNRPHLGAVSLKITYFGNVAEYQLYLR
jgi:hypothetical protein